MELHEVTSGTWFTATYSSLIITLFKGFMPDRFIFKHSGLDCLVYI